MTEQERKYIREYQRERRKDPAYRERQKICQKKCYQKNREAILEKEKKKYEQDKERILARNKAYFEAHKEELKEKRKSYYAENADRIKAISNKYYWEHKEEIQPKMAKQYKKYRAENKDKINAKDSRIRASKLRAMPSWADERAINIYYERAKLIRDIGFDVHVDHIIPLNGKGICGLHVEYNLQIIPARENLSKGRRIELAA